MGMFDSMFGSGSSTVDNSGAYNAYANAMRQRMGVYDPIVNMGNDARNQEYTQYQRLVNDPNSVQDQVASGFYMSPYQQYMEDQTMQQMNYNAANTGMLNSGASQKALQDELVAMTGQYENQYIDRGMDSYYKGLSGYNTLSDLGYNAMGRQDEMYNQAAGADLYGQMSKNAYDAANETDWGQILGTAAGAGIGGYFGGPQGAMAGAQVMGGKGTPSSSNMNAMNLPTSWNTSTWGQPSSNSMFPSMYNTGGWSY